MTGLDKFGVIAKELNIEMKILAKQVLFYISKDRKAGNLVNRFQLTARSRKELEEDIENQMVQLEHERPLLE